MFVQKIDMKFLLLMLFCFHVTLSVPEKLMKDLKACTGSHKFSPEDQQLVEQLKVPKEKQSQCVISCVMTKVGVLQQDGSIDVAGVTAKLKQGVTDEKKLATATKLVADCAKSQTGNDSCSRGISGYGCLMSKSEAAGFKSDITSAMKEIASGGGKQ